MKRTGDLLHALHHGLPPSEKLTRHILPQLIPLESI